jgi:hypothetical protein
VAGVQKFFEGQSYAVRVVRAVEESHSITAKLVALQLGAAKQTALDEVSLLGHQPVSPGETREFFHKRCIGYVPKFLSAGARTWSSVFIR